MAKRDALERLNCLLTEYASSGNLVLVEGPRDVVALRRLGYNGEIVTCSRVHVSNVEMAEIIASEGMNTLILTDFDQEGEELNRIFSELLEHMGVVVEKGLRAEVGRLMAVLCVRVVEALDNVSDSLNDGC